MNRLFLLVLLIQVRSIKIEKVMKFGSPPPPQINPSSSYSAKSNQIFLFGGETFGNSLYSSSLFLFDLKNSTWEELIPLSSLTPESLILSRSFVQDQNKLIVFFGKTSKGISSEVYSFDLKTSVWSTEKFTGDSIPSSIRGGNCIFEYNSTQYFGLFGGITMSGKSENLYLINIETLEVKLMESKGEGPGKQAYGSLVYYNESLYYFGFDEESNLTLFFKYSLGQETWSEVESDAEFLPKRNEHASFIHEDKLYVYFGHDNNRIMNNWQAFNFITWQWELSQDSLESIRDYSYLYINSELYIICGYNEDGYTNSIISYEAESSKQKTIVQYTSIPAKRGYHASFEYGNNLYIFGGSSEGKYFNDMWKFDLSTSKWTEVKMKGDIPSPRDKMNFEGVKGVGFLLIGGRSENTVFDDFYHFAPENFLWTMIHIETSSKVTRFSGCLNYYVLNLFFIGGQDFSSAYSDIFRIDYFLNKSFKIPGSSGLSIELTEHRCWLHLTDSNNYLYVFGGTDYYNTPNEKTYKFEFFDIASNNISISLTKTIDNQINLASSISIKNENYVFIIGGLIWGDKVNEYLYVFDLTTDTLQKDSFLGDLNLIGHSSVQIGNSIYIFGGLLTKEGYQISSTGTNGLHKLVFESTDKYQLTCSNGKIVSSICEPCPKGTYYLNEACLECKKGTYNSKIGAHMASECYPCKAGYFNDEAGASYCKQCPFNKYCPTGSAFYTDYSNTMVASDGKTKEYTQNSEFIENIITISSLSMLGLLFICLISVIFFEKSKKYLIKFDMFVNSHDQALNVPVIYRKTSLGGLFSIIFVLFAICTVATSFLSFFTDNITQSQTLIPSIAYSGSIKADYIEFTIKLHIFGGACVVNNKCDPDIRVSFNGFSFEDDSTSCMLDDNNCIIKIKYTGFEIEKISKLRITLYQLQPYCSIISLNVSVSSSVPNEFSKVFIPLYTPSDDETFKGTGASKFKIEFIPSVRKNQVFYSESSKWPSKETGFHLQNLYDHETGTTVDHLSFYRVAGLVVEIDIQSSNSILVTERNFKYTTSLFLGTLLGSIFGLSGTAALLLNFVESAENIIIKRKLSKEKMENVINDRKFILSNFSWVENKLSRKSSDTSE